MNNTIFDGLTAHIRLGPRSFDEIFSVECYSLGCFLRAGWAACRDWACVAAEVEQQERRLA
jgi:hypothetical protein